MIFKTSSLSLPLHSIGLINQKKSHLIIESNQLNKWEMISKLTVCFFNLMLIKNGNETRCQIAKMKRILIHLFCFSSDESKD